MPLDKTNHNASKYSFAYRQSFDLVFEEFYPGLCFYAERILQSRTDAEDVVENLFVKLWQKKMEFSSRDHLRSFLYKSTKNACLDFIKTAARSAERNSHFLDTAEDYTKSHLTNMIRAEVIREIHQAIESLPAQCGMVIRKSYIEGLSLPEIAQEMSLSVQTVKNHKLRGLAILRKKISQDQFMLLMIYPYAHLLTQTFE